ncbi:relaxase/mobilization nuclease domain-containing protein [Enhydrobacter aerosaccus]|uniref:relaxase/mobilization nuclease domain-containing protein n=1 Tax=Enhydrobacter aerosaccus TaxID=225324 RepID=UPI000A2F887F|nr:VirD2 family relaxase/mobilization nuclease [Enhydrobacter aerosaccus]
MTGDDDFRVRPGRIRSTRVQRARPFIAQALAAAQRAGGSVSRSGKISPGHRSRFGRGQRASVQANRFITSRSRGAVVKARVVRHGGRTAPLATHLNYLRREGVTRDGEKARLFGPGVDTVSPKEFAERCDSDRHHFRFIVSPDDAVEMADLRSFTRELVGRMEKDLGTRLDWVAVDHWNTEHPHVHLIVRGVGDDGENLVISRDYIKDGMRDRARDLISQELGPRTDREIRRALERQIDADRWTNLDRQLVLDCSRAGIIDLAPHADRQPDAFLALKVGRLRRLESLGLADQVGPGQWTMSEKAEVTLRELGQRGDIIKRIHRGLTERGIERGAANYVLAGESLNDPVVGQLIARGLDDELKGTAYAVVDGADGRTHHLKLPDLEAAGDGGPGSIVELRKFDDASGQRRVALAVRSDLTIEQQVTATGATWLDRQAIARDPAALGEGGFGAAVREALDRRAEHLIGQGLAERQSRGVSFNRNLIETLRRRELDAVGAELAAESGRQFNKSGTGEYVAGAYQRRIALASGRFAMIDDGLGFQLVPWTPSLEKQLGRHVSGVARSDGGVDWSFGRKRGVGL